MSTVVIPIVLGTSFLVSAAMFLGFARYFGGHRREGDLKPSDIAALSALLDREDELFLRKKLSRSVFFSLKRQRIGLSLRYIARLSRVLSNVLRLRSADWQVASVDPDVDFAAKAMVDLASQVRLQCLTISLKLAVEFVFPSVQLNSCALIPQFRALQESITHLQRLTVDTRLRAMPAL